MDYRILLVKNNYKKKLNFKKGLDWFADNTPLKITVDEIETNFTFNFSRVGNETYTGGVPNNLQVNQLLLPLVPKGKYNSVVIVSDNDNTNNLVRISICYDMPLYPDTDMIYVSKVSDKGATLNHEIIHSLFKNLWRKGIYLNDPMDTYLRDNVLETDNGVTNRTMALDLLKPYWDKICKPITITQTIIKAVTPTPKPPIVNEPKQVPYTDDFKKAVEVILMHEGGYVNNPKDTGGETNFGISKKVYPKEDIKNLTKERAIEIYYSDYWLPAKCNVMPYRLALNVFDMAVNAGVKTSLKLLQTALGVKSDGIIGNQTLSAINSASNDIVYTFTAERIKYYSKTTSWETFKNGWISRALKTLSYK